MSDGPEQNILAPYTKEIEDVLKELGTNKYGLSEEESAERLNIYGFNELREKKGKSVLFTFIHQFINPLNAILLFAAVISIVADHLADMIVIIAVILINSIFGFIQEHKAEAAIEALRKRGAPEAKVVRRNSSGKSIEFEIEAKRVVPGDILSLSAGDRVPADARLIEAMNVHIDESMLTGESVPVSKNLQIYNIETPMAERKNMIYGGSLVVHGRAKSAVVNTGMNTEIGKIATLIQETEKAESPIKGRIRKLTKWLGVLALIAALFVFITGLLRGIELLDLFTFTLATAVSSIPEGLPIVVTVTLAVAVNRMARRNAIIRKIQAIDTLGTVSAIVSDKTGTLTTNQMTVRKVWTLTDMLKVTGSGFEPVGDFINEKGKIEIDEHPLLRRLLTTMILCNDADLLNHPNELGDHWKVTGDPTEGALVVLALKGGVGKERAELDYPRVDEIPFDSAHKYMATFHESQTSKNTLTCVKGAPEVVIAMCSKIAKNNQTIELNEEIKTKILQIENEMATQALRVLGFACLETIEKPHDVIKSQFPEIKELVFLGLVGMIDPPRSEVKNAIKLCRKAGISVFMATGDHKLTAVAIGEELDISSLGIDPIVGTELDKMSDDDLRANLRKTRVFARVSPDQKYRIVKALQNLNYQVAVTGDGVNDAPALKAAQVGIAMGITGTDVTKETADVVLTDDNFASIVNAIEEGRGVFENIKKVVKYLIATNMGEVATIIFAFLLLPLFFSSLDPNEYLIFTAIQILWINLVTDGVLDITLAVEPKDLDIMNDPPRKPESPIIDLTLLRNALCVSLMMAIGVISLYIFYLTFIPEKAKTIAFITLAMFQVFNAINCRSRSQSVFAIGFFTNKFLLIAIVFSVTLQFLTTVIPGFQLFLNTVPLDGGDWLLLMLVASSVWLIDEIRKWIQSGRHKNKG